MARDRVVGRDRVMGRNSASGGSRLRRAPRSRSRSTTAPSACLGCGLMGSTLMRSLQKYYLLTEGTFGYCRQKKYNIYIYIYICISAEAGRRGAPRAARRRVPERAWILCRGGCSGSGGQWIGVVLYSKLVYNVM